MNLQSLTLKQGPMFQQYVTQKEEGNFNDEIHFNHKPAKNFLTEKRRESAKTAKPQI